MNHQKLRPSLTSEWTGWQASDSCLSLPALSAEVTLRPVSRFATSSMAAGECITKTSSFWRLSRLSCKHRCKSCGVDVEASRR